MLIQFMFLNMIRNDITMESLVEVYIVTDAVIHPTPPLGIKCNSNAGDGLMFTIC